MGDTRRNAAIFVGSAALCAMVFPWLASVFHGELANLITTILPGVIFSVALWLAFPRRMSIPVFAVSLVVVTTGWYAAYMTAQNICDVVLGGLYGAGAVAGAIGGLSVGLAAWSQPNNRGLRPMTVAVAAGSLLGAIALPAGFLFEEPSQQAHDFIILTFLIWQPGVGFAVLAAGRRNSP